VGIFLVAGILALIVRLELAQPGLQAVGEDTYNRVFTMHGTMMIFLFAAQVSTGLANSFVPLQIGAADVAFPRLNAMSYWLYLFGALMVLSGFRVSLTLVPGCCGTLAADSCWSPLLAPPGHGGWAMRSSLRLSRPAPRAAPATAPQADALPWRNHEPSPHRRSAGQQVGRSRGSSGP
jgi:cytochrome c oxidase subunit I